MYENYLLCMKIIYWKLFIENYLLCIKIIYYVWKIFIMYENYLLKVIYWKLFIMYENYLLCMKIIYYVWKLFIMCENYLLCMKNILSQNWENDYQLRYTCLFVRMYVRMEQLGLHWTDFHEIWSWRALRKSVEKILDELKSDKLTSNLLEALCCAELLLE
jgi:hypothetical protein